MERCDWSIGSVYKHRYEASMVLFTSGFGNFISSAKSAHFRNLSKWNFKINFQCERGLAILPFIHSLIRGGGWPLAVFRRAFQPTASAEA